MNNENLRQEILQKQTGKVPREKRIPLDYHPWWKVNPVQVNTDAI